MKIHKTVMVSQEEIDEWVNSSAELRSLKISILQSDLKDYFPQKEGMSFHDKVVFAISIMAEKAKNS
jgi:hypothetical protein